jgi:molybdopterin-guanine dinucleotide biosynthesis protein A
MTIPTSDREIVACVAGVLVGGRSRRMGCSKALLALPDGRTLVEHVAGVASEVAQEVVILGRLDSIPAALARYPILPDAKPNGGPLAGLCSLLVYARERWALLLACDMPLLTTGVVERIRAQAGPDTDAVAFWQDDRRQVYHACCAFYHPRILPEASDELTAGKGSLQNLLRRVRVAALVPEAEETCQLANVNTPEDLARALSRRDESGSRKDET